MRSSRSAFTMFDLLIVLAILLILIGLLLPAVQRVRAAAARMQSSNNLKQIGLAVMNYESSNGFLPSGSDDQHFSALAHVLPYIEQDAVHRQIDFAKPCDDEANAKVAATIIKTFLDPADVRSSVVAGVAPTNYLFCAGSQPALEDNDGIVYSGSKSRIAAITDGTSNTILTGETLMGDGGKKAVTVRLQHVRLKKGDLKGIGDDAGVKDWKDDKNIVGDRCSAWIDGRFLKGQFTMTRTIDDERPDVDCGGVGGLSGLRSVGAVDGAQCGFCDGSVRVIRKTATLATLKALATRAGGEVVNPNDY